MIAITVQGYLTLQEPLGKRQVSVDPGTDLLALLTSLRVDLIDAFGGPPTLAPVFLVEYLVVLLNGRSLKSLPAGINTVLKDGDQVAIFPPLAGG